MRDETPRASDPAAGEVDGACPFDVPVMLPETVVGVVTHDDCVRGELILPGRCLGRTFMIRQMKVRAPPKFFALKECEMMCATSMTALSSLEVVFNDPKTYTFVPT